MSDFKDFQEMVTDELEEAREKFGPIHSGHEAYAVILEELQEFWEACRKWKGERYGVHALKELVQIAAMAQRTAEDLGCMDFLNKPAYEGDFP